MLWRSFVIFFTLSPSDLNTTLTYVLMDNLCPCFSTSHKKSVFTSLRESKKILPSTIIYEPILMKICEHYEYANISFVKYDLKGH